MQKCLLAHDRSEKECVRVCVYFERVKKMRVSVCLSE